jgi:arginine/lysine/histidine transporter system substrate-binding protein
MAKILTVALVVIMLVVGFGVGLIASPILMAQNSSSTDPIWDNIQKTGVIKVGTDPTWPPYQLRDDQNNIVGFEVDLANAAAAKLNLTIQWNDVGFGTIISSVQGKQLDMGVSGFSIRPDRLDQVSFTIPHSITRAQVIMLKSTAEAKHITANLTSLSQLKDLGITVGSQLGEVEESELIAAGVAHKSWSDSATAVEDMVSSNPSVQAVYAETPITKAWIEDNAAKGIQIEVIYDHPYWPVAFVVNKNAHTFLDKMDGALATLSYEGTIDQLKEKWHANFT